MAKQREKTREMLYIALMTAVTAVCSWINIPSSIPFTMQTFAIFSSLLLLGGRRSLIMTVVYLLLGAIGVPVLAGFSGGIGVMLGATGGYLIGFVVQEGVYWLLTAKLGESRAVKITALVLGLVGLYAFGTAWFVVFYMKSGDQIGVLTALSWCVLPYIVPDLVKMALAWILSERLKRQISL